MRTFILKLSELFWNNIFVILTLVAVGVCYTIYHQDFLPDGKETETIIAIVVFFTGLFYNLINFKIARDQFFKSLFTEFNLKYDAMNEALNAIIKINEKSVEKDDDKPSEAGSPDTAKYFVNGKEKTKENIIIDYLNLCAEEYLWYKKGRIDIEVWAAWKAGMIYYFKQDAFKDDIEKQKVQKDSYYGLFEEVGDIG